MENLTVEFIVGGVVYAIPPLRWHWHRKVIKEFVAATKSVEQLKGLVTGGGDADLSINDALIGLEGQVPLVDAGLGILVAALEQEAHLGNYKEPVPTFETLSMALTMEESLKLIQSIVLYMALMNPQDDTAGEASAAAQVTQNLGTETPNP